MKNNTFVLSKPNKYFLYPFVFVFLSALFGFPFYAFVVFLFEPYPDNLGPLFLLGLISAIMGWALIGFCSRWIYKIEILGDTVYFYYPWRKKGVKTKWINSIKRRVASVRGKATAQLGKGVSLNAGFFSISGSFLELTFSKNKKIILVDIKDLNKFVNAMKHYSNIDF